MKIASTLQHLAAHDRVQAGNGRWQPKIADRHEGLLPSFWHGQGDSRVSDPEGPPSLKRHCIRQDQHQVLVTSWSSGVRGDLHSPPPAPDGSKANRGSPSTTNGGSIFG